MATAGRLRCLQALAFGALGLSRGEKEKLLERLVGKRSFHALSDAEADTAIDQMKRMAGQTPTRPQARERRRARQGVQTGDVTMLVTPAQRERLGELTRELIAAGVRSGYIEGARLRACRRPYPQTSGEAEKCIEALKALGERVAAGWRPEVPA